ncbi:histone deacetylase 8 [Impatiens glandulifera]|uniref:histone deacetylase 8 n=1 Tax=Impatiens glandulifera TaxID=253017 RepID=UPI001FB1994A|nr:histone deacetylase 8 [Impatiens glandulifera]
MAKVEAEFVSPPSISDRIHVFWHDGMLDHNAGTGVFDTAEDPGFLDVLEKHPENADRIKNIVSILRRGPLSPYISWHSGQPALISDLLTFHTPDYISKLIEADKKGGNNNLICPGTFLNPGSWSAALLAAGTTLSAMKHILDGQNGKIAYALVRPPGHHAQPDRADGYCFLNNAGLAVQLALDSGCKRVAVIDIDVHYGNGTASGFYKSDKVLTVSLHMNHGSWGPSHPQSGRVDEIGEGDGFGYNLNVMLPNGTGDNGYEFAMTSLVSNAVERFDPDMLVLVVGQDASAFDPNGRQCLTMKGYETIGSIMRSLADRFSEGRLLIVQEGGYHVTYSAYCLHAMLNGTIEGHPAELADPIAYYPDKDDNAYEEVISSIKQYLRNTNVQLWKDI